jgi:hypothetical protein
LPDVTFCQVDNFPGSKDRLHGVGVAGDLLLVAAGERLNVQIRKEQFHFPVGELRTLNSGTD